MKSMFFCSPVVFASALVLGLSACGLDAERDASESALGELATEAAVAERPMRPIPFPTLFPIPTFAPTAFPGFRQADLVAQAFVFGAPVRSGTTIRVPASVVIRNAGTLAAGSLFKIAALYTGHPLTPGTTFTVAFRVGAEFWYPLIPTGFAAGTSRTVSGTLIFPEQLSGTTLRVRAAADSCSGDEFMPTFCRVAESNESNNEGVGVSLRLP